MKEREGERENGREGALGASITPTVLPPAPSPHFSAPVLIWAKLTSPASSLSPPCGPPSLSSLSFSSSFILSNSPFSSSSGPVVLSPLLGFQGLLGVWVKIYFFKERLSWGYRMDRESGKAWSGHNKCPTKVPFTPPSSPDLSPPTTIPKIVVTLW